MKISYDQNTITLDDGRVFVKTICGTVFKYNIIEVIGILNGKTFVKVKNIKTGFIHTDIFEDFIEQKPNEIASRLDSLPEEKNNAMDWPAGKVAAFKLKNKKMQTITIRITQVLCGNGHKPYLATCKTHKIKKQFELFNTLKDLKEYYQIKKITKTGEKEWALSAHKRHEWNVYEAQISANYIIKKYLNKVLYSDGLDYSKLEINSWQYPGHEKCVLCGSTSLTIIKDKEICHECGYIYE